MVSFRILNNALLAVTLLTFSSGCSMIRSFWGEKAPEVGRISVGSSGGPQCPSADLILKGTDDESRESLQCWLSQLEGAWTQVEGEKKGELTESEIRTLVRKGVIAVPGDSEITLKRLFTAKRLLGFTGPITKEGFEEWATFAKQNRWQIRDLYLRFKDESTRVRYTDLRAAAHIAASALSRMNWSMDSTELAHATAVLMDVRDHEIRSTIPSAMEVGINIFNLLCPTFSQKDIWHTQEIASCLVLAAEHFAPGAAWFEFMLNPVDDLSRQQSFAIKRSMEATSQRAKEWFRNENLSPIYTARLIAFANRLGANPESSFFPKGLIEKFGGRSNDEKIYPEVIPYLLDLARDAHSRILDVIPVFIDAVHEGNCTDPSVKQWTQCALKDYSPYFTDQKLLLHPIGVAVRVKNLKHGQKAAPLDGALVSRILYYNEFSKRIIKVFDNPKQPNSLISADLNDDDDELSQLIDFGVATADTVTALAENIRKRLKGYPIQERAGTQLNQQKWNTKGFARLIAMTNEILVRRTPDEHNFFLGIISNLTNINPGSRKLYLDQAALTAILTMIDSLGPYRDAYLARIDKLDRVPVASEALDSEAIAQSVTGIAFAHKADSDDMLVDRDSVLRSLPEIFRQNFPRTYRSCSSFQCASSSCQQQAFMKSCGIALDEILPTAVSSKFINAGDLDIVTIIGAAMEGVLDSCDRDGDGRLQWTLFDGDDELDCGFARANDVVQRLRQSSILVMSDEMASLLNLVNSIFFTRMMGKGALVKGNTEWIALNIPLFLFNGTKANIGSMYALISDVADPDRARAIKYDRK